MTDDVGEQVKPAPHCTNCSAEFAGQYCSNCGQNSDELPTKLVPLIGLLLSYLSGIQGTALRTIRTLLLRPGRLTRDYVSGRRVRYANPVQVYVWCTAMFFMLHAYAPLIQLDRDTGTVTSSLSVVSISTHISPQTMAREASRAGSVDRFVARFDNVVTATLPIMLITLVAVSSLLLRAFFWRETALTHIIFALHWSAFYFTLEAVRQVLAAGFGAWGGVTSLLGSLVIWAYLTIAMRVAYQRSWLGSVARATIGVLVFAALLGGWLWSTSELARLFA